MILKHRDRELLRFDWIQPFGVCHVELNRKVRQYLPLAFRDKAAQGGPVKIEFTGPGRLLQGHVGPASLWNDLKPNNQTITKSNHESI